MMYAEGSIVSFEMDHSQSWVVEWNWSDEENEEINVYPVIAWGLVVTRTGCEQDVNDCFSDDCGHSKIVMDTAMMPLIPHPDLLEDLTFIPARRANVLDYEITLFSLKKVDPTEWNQFYGKLKSP